MKLIAGVDPPANGYFEENQRVFGEEMQGAEWFNSLIWSYKLSLGDFDAEGFSGEN